jgi:hypothetical protein
MTGRLLRSLLLLSLGSWILVATALPSPAAAATSGVKSTPETALHRIQRTVARIDAEAKTPEGEALVVARLSGQLGVSADSLQAEHDTWSLGYGEIAMAYGFARASRSGKTVEDVVGMRSAGTGWLDIAKELHVKVDAVANRMKRHVAPTSKR